MFIILILYGRFAGAQRAFFMSRSETLRDMKRIFVMQRPYHDTDHTDHTSPPDRI